MINYVTVGVALSRPPKIDEYRRYCVVAATAQEAELIAQQMAAATSVMPVYSRWESSHRAGPVEPFGAMDCTCWAVPWGEEIADGEEGWMMEPDCPHHSEDTAAWAALDAEPVNHGIRSAECEAGICDCDGAVPQVDEWEDPPTPETANAGGPDTDDTPAIWPEPVDVSSIFDGQHVTRVPGRYATGAIVPDELKRRVDTIKVSSPDRYAPCDCDDWWYYYDRDRPGDKESALAALDAHRTRLNTDGTPECPRSPNRRPGLAKRVLRWWTQLHFSPRRH